MCCVYLVPELQVLWALVLYFFISSVASLSSLTCSVFLGVSDQQVAQGSIRKRKEKLHVEEDLANYHEWMQRTCLFGGLQGVVLVITIVLVSFLLQWKRRGGRGHQPQVGFLLSLLWC